jgi:hypothetical protein
MSLVNFLVSTRGRIIRAIAGFALILLGWFFLWYHGGIVVALVGLLLVLSAVNDVCLLAMLYDRPIDGDSLRAHQHDRPTQHLHPSH